MIIKKCVTRKAEIVQSAIIHVFSAGLWVLAASPVTADDSFQEKMLFEPGQGLLKAEARGRVMIYDGMESDTVERAMDEQFERIENMMFIRTRTTLADGSHAIEDDGC